MILLLKILAGAVVLGLLIFIHETGHFLVAKAFGVRVPVYSFGFGRRLFGVERHGTDYRVSAIPVGGYVRLWGADPYEVEGREPCVGEVPRGERALQDVSVWARFAIYAAGPAASLVVPYFLFAVLLMAGEPQLASVVGTVVRGSPADRAGLQPGDRVVAVDGEAVTSWSGMAERWDGAGPTPVPVRLTVERLDQRLELRLEAPAGPGAEGGPGGYGLRVDVPSNEIGVLHPSSPAALAGLRTGDRVVSVDGRAVSSWPEASALLRQAGERVAVAWEREGLRREAELVEDATWIPAGVATLVPDQALERWGLQTATLFVDSVAAGSAAEKAGIQQGDFLFALAGQRLGSWYEVLQGVADALVEEGERRSARPVALTVLHGTEALSRVLEPEVVRDTDAIGRYYWRPILGISRRGGWADGPTVRVYYGPGPALLRAGTETVLLVRFTLEQLVRIATGDVAAEESVGGPVEIVRQATQAAERGLFDVARLLGMISISVGIFNLLPVPVLDGGHLLFYGLEALRGRPVSAELRERAQIVGVMLLAALMIFAIVNDVRRLIGGG